MATVNTASWNAASGARFQSPDGYGLSPVILPFEYTAGSALAANDYINMVKLPGGHVWVLTEASWIATTGFGSGRTIDVGHDAYVDGETLADVAADDDALKDGLNAQNAATWNLDAANDVKRAYKSRDGVTLRARILGNTMPANATLKGYVAILRLPQM